jgi:hypothetical protein
MRAVTEWPEDEYLKNRKVSKADVIESILLEVYS